MTADELIIFNASHSSVQSYNLDGKIIIIWERIHKRSLNAIGQFLTIEYFFPFGLSNSGAGRRVVPVHTVDGRRDTELWTVWLGYKCRYLIWGSNVARTLSIQNFQVHSCCIFVLQSRWVVDIVFTGIIPTLILLNRDCRGNFITYKLTTHILIHIFLEKIKLVAKSLKSLFCVLIQSK